MMVGSTPHSNAATTTVTINNLSSRNTTAAA